MARLLYGCGLPLMECLRLRVKDIDFEQCQIVVCEGKGEKDRLTMLPFRKRFSLTQIPTDCKFIRKLFELK